MFIDELEDVDLEVHGVRLPIFPFSDELKNEVGVPIHYNNWEALEFLVEKGFEDRLAKGEIEAENLQGYRDRLDYEMGVIAPTDFGEYLLMVWDVVYIAKKNKIGIGPGRGSAASSLILYFLNVTDVDPLKYNLYFERFLSPSRTKANVVDGIRYYSDCPDVDIDISDTGRGRLIEILKEKYEGRFCKISTHGTLQGKSCIKNVCKILLKYSEEESKYISNMISSLHGKVFDLDKAREEEPKFEKFCKDNELAYTVAKKLYELIVSEGAHASAYLVPFKPLMGNIPLKLVKNKDTGESELATAANMNYVQMENIKLDLLGLKAVSIIDDVCESVGITPKDFDISWDTVYSHLQNVETPYGLFQISGDCNLRVVNKVKPKSLDHMAAVVALARPGALQFVDKYSNFTNKGEVESVHEFFDDVVRDTGGQVLYQETTMRMCEKIGLSKEEGEKVRKCVSGDTRFLSKTRGWIKITTLLKEGYKEDLFLVMNGKGEQQWKPIRDIWSNGVRRVVFVEGKNGMTVKATQYHQFLTDEGWKARSRLKLGDELVCTYDADFDGENTITEDMAIVMAGIITEGYFPYNYVDKKGKMKKVNSATFTNFDKQIYDRFYLSACSWFGEENVKKRPNGKVIFLNKESVKKLEVFVKKGKSENKDIPEIIFRQSKKIRQTFLSFMFACEGTITEKEISLTSKSRKLIQKLQLLLINFGIRSFINKKKNARYGNFWVLFFGKDREKSNAGKFLDFLSSELTKNQKNRAVSFFSQKSQFLSSGDDYIPKSFCLKMINQYPQVLGASKNGSGSSYKSDIGRSRFLHIAKHAPTKRWEEWACGKQSFTKVKDLEKASNETEVFDFTIDEETPFIIANGMVIHNCIGKKLTKEVGKWKDIIFQKVEENGLDIEIAEKLWRIINDSASYSFNKCTCPYTTYVEVKGGIKKMKDVSIGEWILGYNVENECDEWVQVVDLIPGFANLVKAQIGSETIECSLKHKFLCEDGEMRPLSKIVEEGLHVVLKEDRPQKPVILSEGTYKESIDFEVNSSFHNFYANGIVVSNSHSVSYGLIGVYTTYLKWKYPQQFFLSCLKIAATRSDFTDQFDSIQRELPHFGIKLLGPDIVKSSENFEIDGENIRFGLKEIKGISDNSLSKLRSFLSKERSGKFDTFLAAKEAGLNIGVFCSLIQSGTFSDLAEDRTRIVLEACIWNKLSEKERNWCARNGEKYNFNLLAMMKDYLEWKDANGKKINKETRLNTLRKECANYFNIYHQNRQYPQLADYYYEKTLLGFSYSQNLKDIFGAKNEWLRNISETKDFVPLKGAVELIATVSEIKEGKSKNGNKYFKMTLVDEKDTIQAMMLGDRLEAYVAAEKALPEEGDIVYIHGSSGGDIIWVNRMSLPKEKIFLKLRDLKKFEKEAKEEVEKSVKIA